MSSVNIIFAATCWLCSLVFGVIALWAFKRRDPVHFWSGSIVRHEEIADIPSYNRANGLMWAIYAVCIAATGISSLFSITIGAILLGIICVPGILVLIIAYNGIYSKYRSTSTSVTYRNDHSTSKTPKAVMIAIAFISVITLAVVGALFFYGDKDPDVSILDDCIQIKAMYGLTINFSEVTDISLIEKSMSAIGVGARVNGYSGVGQALKGNFKSDTLGETLLIVQSNASPTIKIERNDKKDIYISFRSSERTEQLYRELLAAIQVK